MSDPYYDFTEENNLMNIQVNVFNVKNPIRNMSISEKRNILYKDVMIFNPHNKEKPSIKDIKLTNVVKKSDKIYLSDTIEVLLNKIAINCKEEISGKEIFAWVNNKSDTSLRFSLPLGIKYNDLYEFFNPYIDRCPDDNFVNSDGSVKRNSKYSLDYHSILNDYIEVNSENSYNIYYTTLDNIEDYLKSDHCPIKLKESSELQIENGYKRKYFPLLDLDISEYLSKISKKIELIENQKKIQDRYSELPIDCRQDILIYRNKDLENSIYLHKIFEKFILTDNIPYIKLQTDTYLESQIKLNTDIINNTYENVKDLLTKETFKRWNNTIRLSNGFTMPRSIDMNNSLLFIIYDKNTDNYAKMLLYSTGKVEFYCEKFQRIEKLENKKIRLFIEKGNSIIRKINNNPDYSSKQINIPIINKYPKRIDISYIYDISVYNSLNIGRIFNSLNSEFINLVDEKEDFLHLLYCKKSNYENLNTGLDFITILKKKKLENEYIVKLLSQRYNLTKKKSEEQLDDWLRLNSQKPIPVNQEYINISIYVEKVLDRIKVTFLGLESLHQLHECINSVNFVMGVYKEKYVKKNKDLPDEIKEMITSKSKNIVTSVVQPEPVIETKEIEPVISEEEIVIEELNTDFEVKDPKNKILIIFNHGQDDHDKPSKNCVWKNNIRNFASLTGKKVKDKEVLVYSFCTDHLGGDDWKRLWKKKFDFPYKGITKLDKRVNANLDLIKKFIELGIPNNQIFIAGQSCGGWATMMLISKYPDKVAGGISTHHACYGELSKKYKVKKVGIEKALENFKKKKPGPAVLRENQIKDISKAKNLPVLGICRGMQMIALHAGVGLHHVKNHVAKRHQIYGIVNGRVNSFHEFAIDSCPPDFEVIARGEDDEIEAIAATGMRCEAWMWHPEREKKFSQRDLNRATSLFG